MGEGGETQERAEAINRGHCGTDSRGTFAANSLGIVVKSAEACFVLGVEAKLDSGLRL